MRIEENEKRLDDLMEAVVHLNHSLDEFELLVADYKKLNKYYGSSKWFLDKENYEKGKYTDIKAGVLSEDAVWNLDEEVSSLLERMNKIIRKYKGNN